MKHTLFIILFFVSQLISADLLAGGMYTGWPENDSLFHTVIQIGADTAQVTDRNPVQLIYMIDVSEVCAGRVREGLIEGGRRIINSLRDGDGFGIVLYSQYARTLFPLKALTPENRPEAIEMLERISTESGRDITTALKKVNSEFELRAGSKIDGKYLVLSSLGAVTEGEKGNELYEELVEGTKDSINGYTLYTVGYGEKFDEDVLIKSAEFSGGRAFFVGEQRPDSLANVFQNISDDVSSLAMKDINIYMEFPDSDIEICYFGTTTPMPNPIKIKQLSRGKKYNILASLKNRPKNSAALDIELDYYSLSEASRLTSVGGTKIGVSTEPIYVETTSPSLIQYSILNNFSDNVTMFRRAEKEMTPKELKTFRTSYAFQFQEQVVNRTEQIRKEINTPPMNNVYNGMNLLFSELRDGIMPLEYIIRKVKYERHHTIHDK